LDGGANKVVTLVLPVLKLEATTKTVNTIAKQMRRKCGG